MFDSLRALPFSGELHIRLFDVRWLKLLKNEWSTQHVRDPFWRFYVNDRDGAIVQTPAGDYPLRANRLYIVAQDVFFSCANTKAVGHFFVHFDVLGLPRPILKNFFAAPLEIENAARLVEEARLLSRRLQHGEALSAEIHCRIKSLLLNGLGEVFASRATEIAPLWNAAKEHEALAPALEYIENNLCAPLGNEVLARCCHWSRDHFALRFRVAVGQTPAQYVQTRRIAFASQQLLFSEKTIEQIAHEAGFADRFHFSRVFAKATGRPPAAYRKQTRV